MAGSFGSISALFSDAAHDTFEYMLVIGIVVVLVVAGLFAFDDVVAAVMHNSCPSVDTAQQAPAGDCINN